MGAIVGARLSYPERLPGSVALDRSNSVRTVAQAAAP